MTETYIRIPSLILAVKLSGYLDEIATLRSRSRRPLVQRTHGLLFASCRRQDTARRTLAGTLSSARSVTSPALRTVLCVILMDNTCLSFFLISMLFVFNGIVHVCYAEKHLIDPSKKVGLEVNSV